MARSRKLLSIAHSYVIALNRRLAHEMALLGKDSWEVTAVAPTFMGGDLRPVKLEASSPGETEAFQLESVPTYLSEKIHFMTYGWRLREILHQNWDMIHCWEEPYILAGGQIAWWTPSHIPIVYRTAQSHNKKYPPPFNWVENYSMGQAVGWICSGRTVAETLKSRQGYDLPMRLIPLGVDAHHFYPNKEAGIQVRQSLDWGDSDVPVVGYLGRFVPEKGLDLLMEVLGQLETPWRALFVGKGPMEDQLTQWANQYPKQVRVCTDVRHNDVPGYLNAMDLLCAPSQTRPNWREQFGRMLIEAFACGVPVIGSDSGEIPTVLEGAGVVVGEQDMSGWLENLSNLLESPEKRRNLAVQGLCKTKEHYSWPIVAQQYLDFFNELSEMHTS
ncbi:glycosyltransferase family 4 protein [Leptothoe sp. LEGE 181152]|nr:glycosyltransferase family 4 protein [Leptothoe sp. LEGE 181152]